MTGIAHKARPDNTRMYLKTRPEKDRSHLDSDHGTVGVAAQGSLQQNNPVMGEPRRQGSWFAAFRMLAPLPDLQVNNAHYNSPKPVHT